MFHIMPVKMKIGVIGSWSAIDPYILALRDLENTPAICICPSGPISEHNNKYRDIDIYTEYNRLIDEVEAIVLPEQPAIHSRTVVHALKRGKHVFLYPRSVRSVSEALQFSKLAHEANVVLGVGTAGCININGLMEHLSNHHGIHFIDLQYHKQYTPESANTSVSEALLVNTQIISRLVNSQVLSIKSKGINMISGRPDIINARLEYDNGCTVNITSNMVADHDEIHGTLVYHDRCFKYDFLSRILTSWNLHSEWDSQEVPLVVKKIEVEKRDLLTDDLTTFITSIRTGNGFNGKRDSGFDPYILTERMMDKVDRQLAVNNGKMTSNKL